MTTDYERAVEACARAAHEANRAYCAALGDFSHLEWESESKEQHESVRAGVQHTLNGATPRESHENWMRTRHAAGWVHGPTEDLEKKTHPCLVPYHELPPEQQMKKDAIFVSTVRALWAALHPREQVASFQIHTNAARARLVIYCGRDGLFEANARDLRRMAQGLDEAADALRSERYYSRIYYVDEPAK